MAAKQQGDQAGPLPPAFRRYLKDLPRYRASGRMSLFWERQLERTLDYYERAPELTMEDVAALVSEAGYGFEPLPKGVSTPERDPAFRAARTAIRSLARTDGGTNPSADELDEPTWRHMRAIHFLGKEGLLDEYLAFIRPLGVRSSLGVARHWYYSRQISELAQRTHGSRSLDILEIGAGAGNLAAFLAVMKRVRSYCIVDLPEMLVHSGYTLARYLGLKGRLVFQDSSLVGRKGTYVLLTPKRAPKLPTNRFDLLLNLNSFMEMDKDELETYFRLIYRTGRPGALFYNVNRRQRALPVRDDGTWDSNPLLYPYRRDDDVLIWEEDPFQTVTRSKWGRSVSLTVTRAGIIRPADAREPSSPS